MKTFACWLVGTTLAVATATTNAEEIAVGNYGVSANGMPFGLASRRRARVNSRLGNAPRPDSSPLGRLRARFGARNDLTLILRCSRVCQ